MKEKERMKNYLQMVTISPTKAQIFHGSVSPSGFGDQDIKHKMGPPRKKSRLLNTQNSYQKFNNNQDLISHLPDDCIFNIFSFLPSYKDRCSCAAVSKKWLVILAHMRSSDFKYPNSPIPIGVNSAGTSLCSKQDRKRRQISKCLQGKKANDTRLAAFTIGIQSQGELTKLCISGGLPFKGITDFGLGIISQSCPSLKSLSLWDCARVTGKGIQSIAKGCSSLQDLDMVDLPFVDDEGLISIAKYCNDLLKLNIESCPLIGSASLIALARHSLKLDTVSLVNCSRLVDEQGIISIASGLPKLLTLKLGSMCIGDDVIKKISQQAKTLSNLSLEHLRGSGMNGLDGTSLKATANGFVGLKRICFKRCQTLNDMGLKEITKSTYLLESLKLEECNTLTWAGLIEVFVNCSGSLKELALVRCRRLADVYPSCSKQVQLSRYPCLRSLSLVKCHGIGDNFLSWIGQACTQLKHLSLIRLRSITDRGVATLLNKERIESNGPNIRLVSVDLTGCVRITDESVFALTGGSYGLNKIRRLILDGCEKLTDIGLKMIAELCPRLVDLDISRCGISDYGVLCLAISQHQHMQKGLEVLSLAGSMGITDYSLRHLQMMGRSLKGLNLKLCPGLTQDGIDSLVATLWWCDLIY